MRHLSRLLILSLLATIVIVVAPAETGYANPPQRAADWSSTMTDVVPKTLQASVGGVVTGASACNTATAVVGVAEATGSRTTEVFSTDPFNGTQCTSETDVDRHGIVYTVETNTSTYNRTIQAYDGYVPLWSKPLGTCATNWGTAPIAAVSIRVGADGGIYYIELDPTMSCNSQPNRLVKLDAKTGNKRFAVDLSGNVANFATQSDRMFTWNGGVAVADGSNLRYFNFIGEELIDRSKTFPWQINQFAVNNSGVAVAVDTTGQWVNPYCPNIVHYNGYATQSLNTYSTGECIQSINKIYALFDGSYSIDFFDGASYGQGNLMVKTFDTNGSTIYEKNVTPNSESGAVNNTVINFDEYGSLLITQRENDSTLTVERFDSLGMSQDSFTAQGVSAPANGIGPVAMRAGSVFIPVCALECSAYMGNSAGSTLYKFPVSNIGDDYPKGYIVNNSKPGNAYVAMGDSFSSGEGNAPYESRTDVSGVNQCHRSYQAYSYLLQDDPDLNLGQTSFVACSGATTNNVRFGGTSGGAWNEGPQVDVLSGETELVTISVGGNDVGFKNFVTGCLSAACGVGTSAYNDITNTIASSAFQDDLRATYLKVLTEASAANVYVVDYPYLVKDRPNDGCSVFPDGLSSNDAAAEQVTTLLNAAISGVYTGIKQDSSLSSAVKNRLHLIEVNYSGSPFDGHDICSEGSGGVYLDSYFYQWNPADPLNAKAFHPNEDGQAAYKSIIKEKIS